MIHIKKDRNDGVGEKVAVMSTPMDKVDVDHIRKFFEAMPKHMQDEMLVLGVANYCLGSNNDDFLKKMHKALFPKCELKYFVRYE